MVWLIRGFGRLIQALVALSALSTVKLVISNIITRYFKRLQHWVLSVAIHLKYAGHQFSIFSFHKVS